MVLGIGGSYLSKVRVAARHSPLVVYRDTELQLAGSSPRLLRLAAARDDKSPGADAAFGALTAHAITVLNRELTAVTDANEEAALLRMIGVRV